MSRLGKKCFIASSGLHALLLLTLVISPAFRPKEETKITPPIRVIDGAVIAAIMNASAVAEAASPARPEPLVNPIPPKPVPEAPPKRESKTEPKSEPKPDPRPQPKPVEKAPPPPKKVTQPEPKPTPPKVVKTVPKPPPKTIKVAALDNLIRRSDATEVKRRREAEEAQRREASRRADDERKRALEKLDSVIDSVQFSSQVNFKSVGGSSSRATMDYGAYVVQTYDRQWREPAQMAGSRHSAEVTVTIRQDGSVADVRISRRSGVGAIDKSIQDLIDAVRRFQPFPAGMDESSKTFTIDFSVRAK